MRERSVPLVAWPRSTLDIQMKTRTPRAGARALRTLRFEEGEFLRTGTAGRVLVSLGPLGPRYLRNGRLLLSVHGDGTTDHCT